MFESAIAMAVWLKHNPPVPKVAGKVTLGCAFEPAAFFANSHGTGRLAYGQRKKHSAEQAKDAEESKGYPAWVVDQETFNLYQDGVDESMIPEEVVLTAAEKAKVLGLRAWAAAETARRSAGAATLQRTQCCIGAETAAPPVRAVVGELTSQEPAQQPPLVQPYTFSPAAVAHAKALAAGPRVGSSPNCVIEQL